MKSYKEWGLPRKIISNVAFWLPVQLIIIILVEYLGLLPSNLIPEKCGFYGIKGGFANLAYTEGCCMTGLIYTIIGSILISKVPLGSRKFWIWFASLYVIYLGLTLFGMMQSEGAWFFEGYGCYILDVWISPLLWLGELFIAKYIYIRTTHQHEIHPEDGSRI